MKEISILLFEKFSNHCLANILEPFRAANTLSNDALYQWQFYTLDGESVSSSSGLPIMPDGAFDPSNRIDDLFIVSSYDHLSLSTSKCRNVLRAARTNAKRIVGLDTGAWLMAAAGLLDGQKATIHWDVFDSFSEQFLSIDTSKERFVVGDNVITCAG
ncbi:MAG: AraC family transcriptional regulator, partial [Hyphomicrobiales bacterium]